MSKTYCKLWSTIKSEGGAIEWLLRLTSTPASAVVRARVLAPWRQSLWRMASPKSMRASAWSAVPASALAPSKQSPCKKYRAVPQRTALFFCKTKTTGAAGGFRFAIRGASLPSSSCEAGKEAPQRPSIFYPSVWQEGRAASSRKPTLRTPSSYLQQAGSARNFPPLQRTRCRFPPPRAQKGSD